MLLSRSWLATHIDLDGLGDDELSDILTFAGVEVEDVQVRGVESEAVVVGEVIEAAPHPDADRLKVCRVNTGDGQPRQIVCGATNYAVGDRVPVALPGAVLPGGFEIKTGKLRGVESAGMMCSGRELGISDDHEGLLILGGSPPVGRPLHDLIPSDTIFEIEVTPNRADLLSHAGLARELAALTGRALKTALPEPAPQRPAAAGEVAMEAPESCPCYTARLIRGVEVGPSPEWLQQRLTAIGLRPINNIVDITNFVLHEVGQPLHAFDLAKLEGGRIVVRTAAEGEKFVALDESEHALTPQDCVIADASRPVALGGVMGGLDSGVTESTRDVLLESAWFKPEGIRRTSRRTGLSSDSSYRFERGADTGMVLPASDLATRLILELAGGQAEEEVRVAGALPQRTGVVELDAQATTEYLGGHVSAEEQADILTRLGLVRTGDQGWRIPTHRADLQRPVDLVEEIARVHGLEKVPSRHGAPATRVSPDDQAWDATRQAKEVLVGLGFFEARTLKLIARSQERDIFDAGWVGVPVRNPLSEDHVVMRASVLPGLLASAARNVSHGASRLALFEAGTVFRADGEGGAAELPSLGLLLAGPLEEPHWAGAGPRPSIFADLRGAIDRLLPRGVKLKVLVGERPGCILAADLLITKKRSLGFLAQVAPARAREMDVTGPLFVAELDLAALHALAAEKRPRFEELPRFPAVTRDVAVEMPLDMPSTRVDAALTNVREKLLVDWSLFDLFTDPAGEKIAADRKSVAWSLTYRHPERTLRSEEVDEAHAAVREAIGKLKDVALR